MNLPSKLVDEHYGIAILSRYPLKHRRTIALPGEGSWYCRETRVALWAEAETPAGPVQIINTHFGLGRTERLLQAQHITELLGAVSAEEPLVLLGDFNSRPRSRALQPLRQHLHDVRTSLDEAGHCRTFPTRRPLVAVDHIFVSAALRPISLEVHRQALARAASDHYPLVAELTRTEFVAHPGKENGGDPSRSPPLSGRTNLSLLLTRLMHGLHRVHHVFVRLFDRIEFHLLLRCEERADLRGGVLHHGAGLFHRFLMDGLDLGLRLVDDRRDFRLLVRRQVQLLGEMLERVAPLAMSHPAVAAVFAVFRSACVKAEGAERERATNRKCNKCSFHELCFSFVWLSATFNDALLK